MHPLNILQVIEFFSPDRGGSVQVAYQLSRYLAHQGNHIVLCTSDIGKEKSTFFDTPFELIRLRSVTKRWKFYITPGLIPWMRKHIKEFDIIHMHNVRTFQNAAIAFQARKASIPYVLSAHGSLPRLIEHHAVKHTFDLLFTGRILREARRVIAVSEVEVGYYLEAGIPIEQISIVHNGLDIDEFKTLPRRGTFRNKYQIAERQNIILFMGRLHKIKQVDQLIYAFADLLSSGLDAILVAAGPDDGELSYLEDTSRKLGVTEHVIFTGPLYGMDKLAAYIDAEVLVSPGVHEIFGLVPFEALMCGTPVIVSDDSGSGQLIKEARAGELFAAGDISDLSSTIKRVILNQDVAQKKVQAGQKYIRENLDWNKITSKLINLYQECLQ